jgi:hypothetical protein
MRIATALVTGLATTVLMLSWSSIVAATPPCSVAFSKMRASHAKNSIAGKSFTFTGSIKNTGSTELKDLYFQLELPEYLVPIKAIASKSTLAGGPGIKLEKKYVWFRKMQLPPRKFLKIKVTIGVKSCQSSARVAIEGIAYQLDSTGQVVCSNEITSSTIDVVGKSDFKRHSKRHAIWDDDDCTTPAPAPTSPFFLVGDNQRCLRPWCRNNRTVSLRIQTLRTSATRPVRHTCKSQRLPIISIWTQAGNVIVARLALRFTFPISRWVVSFRRS